MKIIPPCRRLRAYTFDPSLATSLDTCRIQQTILRVRWEALKKGPVGEYLEVIDYDPASACFYNPVNLDEPSLLAQDGLAPSEGNPQFHQQMAYAVAMTTIQNFERALGRKALWAPHFERDPNTMEVIKVTPVELLRIYPHAMREANAYYSPDKKALLFGYFPAVLSNPGENLPGGLVFTCLSHDVVAHETTHALLDGLHRYFAEPSNPDVLAFHEGFADVVALLQHFTQPEALRDQIAKTRGDLASQNLLGELAHQFGQAIGNRGALRDAIGERDENGVWKAKEPDPASYATATEPHERGAILVAAIFDAFLSIYKFRIADLLRIATGGTGQLAEGNLHPDLVNRLADEATKTAARLLRMVIRALDYCPPVDITRDRSQRTSNPRWRPFPALRPVAPTSSTRRTASTSNTRLNLHEHRHQCGCTFFATSVRAASSSSRRFWKTDRSALSPRSLNWASAMSQLPHFHAQ